MAGKDGATNETAATVRVKKLPTKLRKKQLEMKKIHLVDKKHQTEFLPT